MTTTSSASSRLATEILRIRGVYSLVFQLAHHVWEKLVCAGGTGGSHILRAERGHCFERLLAFEDDQVDVYGRYEVWDD